MKRTKTHAFALSGVASNGILQWTVI